MTAMPVAFFGHGSPMIAIEPGPISEAWRRMAAGIPRPKSILAISAHWETRGTAVTAMSRPQTIHDFGGGFPKALFDKQYPAPGDPALAERVARLLSPTPVGLDEGQWGFDHGTWSVMTHVYPEADIPVVQLSLDVNLSPDQRLDIGRRIAPLRDEGVLILGTGNIVHNLRAMNWRERDCPPFDWSVRFLDEMRAAVVNDEPQRAVDYERMGSDAQLAAPTPEHFFPFLYVLGARRPGDKATLVNDKIEHGSLAMTSFLFEAA